MSAQTVPEKFLEEIKDDVYSAPKTAIIPAIVAKQYETYHTRALAHARTKGEHEALTYLSFYVIWRHGLWRARYERWEDYLEFEVNEKNIGVSVSSVKHKITDIDEGIKRGMEFDVLIDALGGYPMAYRKALKAPPEQLPAPLNEVIKTRWVLGELSSREAMADVRDMVKEPTIWCEDTAYLENQNQFLLKIVVKDAESGKSTTHDLVIQNVTPEVAEWLSQRLATRKR